MSLVCQGIAHSIGKCEPSLAVNLDTHIQLHSCGFLLQSGDAAAVWFLDRKACTDD